jgi:hypothetical protein
MTSFLINVAVAAMLKLIHNAEFNTWVKGLVDNASAEVKADLTASVTSLEAEVGALPGRILGDAQTDVKRLLGSQTGDITGMFAPLNTAIASLTNLINNFNPLHWGQQ